MSVSKYLWQPSCDTYYCCGDCDNCPRAEEGDEDERDIDSDDRATV